MLVLSRRVEDSLVFPDLGITVEVLNMKGKSVRLGVDAPVEIKVLRGELFDSDHEFQLSGSSEHEIRNQLNSLTVAAALAKKLIEKGNIDRAAKTLQQVLGDLQSTEGDCQDSDVQPNKTGPTALLVEDVANERELLSGLLKLHGFQVFSVPDAETAIEFLEDNSKPDFMIVDIGLPKTSGSELIVQVRQNPAFQNITMYAISGQTPEQANINPSTNHIKKWFHKPLEPGLLLSELQSSVDLLSSQYSSN